MTERSFERALGEWLEAGSDRTSPAAIDAVLLAIQTTPQERDLRIPWRFTLMSSSYRIVAAAALVVVVGVGLMTYLGANPGPGRTTSPPTPSPAPSATAAPSSGQSLFFDQSFSSATFGFDARFPAGWQAEPGTTQGTAAELALAEAATSPARFWDHFRPDGESPVAPALLATSAALPPGTTEDAWIEAYQAPQVAQAGRACIPLRATWQAVTIDGHTGGIYVGCGFVEAAVFVDGRVYLFNYVQFSAEQAAVETTGRQILEAFLGTVALSPERLTSPSPGAT